MPKLKPINIVEQGLIEGDEINYMAEVTVTQEGEFRVQFPLKHREELLEIAYEMGIGGRIVTGSANSYMSGKTLDEARSLLHKVFKSFLACAVEETLVISYAHLMHYSIWICQDGALVPNGYMDPTVKPGQSPGRDKGWHGTLDSSHRWPVFDIGLYARVQRKRVFTRSTGTKTEYDEQSLVLGPEGERLNAYCGFGRDFHGPALKFKEIPYTEEAAKFFADALLSMVRMAMQIEQFFAEPAALQTAIQNRATLGMAALQE